MISTVASFANRRKACWKHSRLEAMGLLILSQVILSFQLPFALVPLVQFTGDKSRMAQFANSWWVAALAWLTAAVIIALNALLILLIFRGNS